MRTRDKRRIVRMFLEGRSVDRIRIELLYRLNLGCNGDVESIIREYAIAADARAARREKRRKG